MSLGWRLWGTVVLLAVGLAAHSLLARHVLGGGAAQPGTLVRPLANLPLVLGDWQGADVPVEPRQRYADEHLNRTYVHTTRGQSLMLWIAYSSTGRDRGHHPEVCMAVAGQPEDTSVRQTVSLPGPGEPAQQYRFGLPGERQWVFYWHYTLPSEEPPHLDAIQRLRRRLVERPASITIEVFAPEQMPADAEGAREFVRLVDAALRTHLPAGAGRGSTREPVIMLK
ncbi:MAG: EpsI family protein [Pirellulales bacterium]|nr:EpsI family protein [Pirellulales bacterium]